MKEHEKIPREPQETKVNLSGGLLKTLITTATGAIPTELPKAKADWWSYGNEKGPVLAKAIKDVIYHPPTLRNALESWRRFYAVMFGEKLPAITDSTWDMNQLAAKYVVMSKLVSSDGILFRLHHEFPETFHQTEGSIFNGDLKYIHAVGTAHNPPWYLVCIEPWEQGSGFETGQDENDVLFEELLVQQLYEYWSGKSLTEDWLYANGSRTTETDKVPAISWKNRKMFVRSFRRENIRRNLRHTRFSAIKAT